MVNTKNDVGWVIVADDVLRPQLHVISRRVDCDSGGGMSPSFSFSVILTVEGMLIPIHSNQNKTARQQCDVCFRYKATLSDNLTQKQIIRMFSCRGVSNVPRIVH